MPFPVLSDHPVFGDTDSWLVQEAVMARFAQQRSEEVKEADAWAAAKQEAQGMARGAA